MDYAASERMLKRAMGFLIYLFFVFFIMRTCKSEESNPCSWEETCGKCIQKDPRCAWCNQENFTEMKISRCDIFENLLEKNCSDLMNPQNSYDIVAIRDLSKKGVRAGSAVQIKPLVVDLDLRPDSPQTFSFQFRQATDYPVDLYYLVDLSSNMNEHYNELNELGRTLGRKIEEISSNYSVGVGSFQDKVTPAYDIKKLDKFGEEYPAQGFWLNMGLNENSGIFEAKVTNVIRGIDDPKKVLLKSDNLTGTLDVIMQTIVCQEKMKWRPDAKKLILIATGNDFHHAGDGKMKGIIKPNDGKCHSDSMGYYEQQDYPSLSQINKKIKEHNITIIFAVTDDQMEIYENISSRIFGSTAMKLDNHSAIMQFIKEQYEAMSSSIEITDNVQGSGNIEISYNSTCLDGVNMERNICKNVKPEDTINFTATVMFSHCPENPAEWEKTLEIQPLRRISTLTVYFKMICDCDCRDPTDDENEKFCSGKGKYRCGVCRCDDSHYGEQCECEGFENQTRLDVNQCKRGRDGRICSNRGQCKCGHCLCNEGQNPGEIYSGKYCECSNFTCSRVNNKLCNGHGICDCGKCKCEEGWSGPDCACSNTTEFCLVESDGSMCSGHGTCNCGSCMCHETYYGQFCEDCPSCPGKCQEYGACVECILSSAEETPLEEQCKEICKTLTVVLVDKLEGNRTQTEKSCSVEDDDGCNILFKYEKDNKKNVTIYAKRTRECPSPPDIVAIVSGTIGSIVAAGLILLFLWKFLTYVHDKKEYAKFEKELENAKWDSGENPFFIEPTSTFQNPAYRSS